MRPMFSYRHAFHAGNHADVIKHTTLIATLRHLMQKEPAITLVDTHAGAGLYRLDGDYAGTGGEAKDGVVKVMAACRPAQGAPVPASPALDDYLDLIAGFNPSGSLRVYPGSPFVLHTLMRTASRDKLKLFELHPTDGKTLDANIAQLDAGRQISVARQDCRNRNTTSSTSTTASKKVCTTASMDALTNWVVSSATLYSSPSGKLLDRFSSVALTCSETFRALAPGCWYTAMRVASLPWYLERIE